LKLYNTYFNNTNVVARSDDNDNIIVRSVRRVMLRVMSDRVIMLRVMIMTEADQFQSQRRR
jgi:hypothetical protein